MDILLIDVDKKNDDWYYNVLKELYSNRSEINIKRTNRDAQTYIIEDWLNSKNTWTLS